MSHEGQQNSLHDHTLGRRHTRCEVRTWGENPRGWVWECAPAIPLPYARWKVTECPAAHRPPAWSAVINRHFLRVDDEEHWSIFCTPQGTMHVCTPQMCRRHTTGFFNFLSLLGHFCFALFLKTTEKSWWSWTKEYSFHWTHAKQWHLHQQNPEFNGWRAEWIHLPTLSRSGGSYLLYYYEIWFIDWKYHNTYVMKYYLTFKKETPIICYKEISLENVKWSEEGTKW